MEFRDLHRQYERIRPKIDSQIESIIRSANFILGTQVQELEERLEQYTGRKHCVTCANGTDALILALMTWNIGPGDAVFVSDFSYVASGSCVLVRGATPIFVDVDTHTFNMNAESLERAIEAVLREGKLTPRAVIPVDLFGLPVNYHAIKRVADSYELLILEDAAQGFGGSLGDKKACTLGDISITSFFPSKPLGCYGDGGAIFTDSDETAEILVSMRAQGRSQSNKYDNVRLGLNSRLDTLQAGILISKLEALEHHELRDINICAKMYTEQLRDAVKTPVLQEGYYSSWAQYTIMLSNEKSRNVLKASLKQVGIPSMIYYPIPLHRQKVFEPKSGTYVDLQTATNLSETVLSLPMHPYLTEEEINFICDKVINSVQN